MIDREHVRAKAADKTPNWFASFGAGKPWRKSWFILMGSLQASDEDFAKIEPRFNRAFKDFQVWMAKFKQDPRQHEAGPDSAYYFRDHDFAAAFKWLMQESEKGMGGGPPPPGRRFETRLLIWNLRDKLPYWPK